MFLLFILLRTRAARTDGWGTVRAATPGERLRVEPEVPAQRRGDAVVYRFRR